MSTNSRRALRLGLVTLCHGVLFFFAAKVVFGRLVALLVCAALLGGTVLEIGDSKRARVANVGVPAVMGAILASSFIWLPTLAKVQHWEHPGDANLVSAYLFGYSLLPFFLACVVELAYRLTNIGHDSEPAPRTRVWFVVLGVAAIVLLLSSALLSHWR